MQIPFKMYSVNMEYSKSRGILLRLIASAKGGIYSCRIDGMYSALAKSPWCLLLYSVTKLMQVERRPVEGEAYNPLVDDTLIPSDTSFSAMSFLRTSSIDFSRSLGSPDILAFNE
jgi:hypothetical protein